MASGDNVITFGDNKHDALSRQVLAKRLLSHFRELTNTHMHRILQAMFDTADDALFKMAEHAGDGADKNLYFDSMRIVRLQRTTIEESFFADLNNNFKHYLDSTARENTTSNNIDYNSLELVSEDELEITLATQRLVQKIQSLYQQELSAINKRLAYLADQKEIESACIPFAAESIVNAYVHASESAKFMLEVRIILLKLFDLSCIHGLAALYNEINQEFIDADVLPVIKTTIRKHDSDSSIVMPDIVTSTHTSSHQGIASTFSGSALSDDNLWSTLQSYLSQQRGSGSHNHPGGIIPAGQPISGTVNFVPAVAYTPQELLGSLTTLQQDIEGSLPDGGAHAVGNYVRVQLQNSGNEGSPGERQLHPLDNDLIDVVCLIFDYILDEPQLPQAAKDSIRRLQIPMLKVAILDKQFFSSHGHPARELLNVLAQSALGIDSEDENDPILSTIDGTVQRILDEFSDDIILFSELKQDFEAFLISNCHRESELLSDLERRQQEREEMALARAWVRETLEQHLIGRTLPEVVADIILGPWKDVMLQTYLSEGEGSLLWKTQIRFIDVLTWSVEPKEIKLDKNKLGNIIRQLISTLRDGLRQIDYPQVEIDAIFTALEPYHLASVRGHQYQHGTHRDSVLDEAINNIESAHASMLNEDQGDDPNRVEEFMRDKVILEDIVLEGWEDDPMLDAINDEYLDLARHLEKGKWVEFENNRGQRRHAKLAWKSDLLGEYTFLNWKFDVVADKTLLELAEDLRQGKAKVMNDVPLMDRALSSVLTTLMPKSRS